MTLPAEVVAIDLEQSYKLLNHGPVTLISSAHADQSNVMAAAWTMPLDFNPPKVAVVIDSNTVTRRLVDASGSFAINIPSRAIAQETLAVGSVSASEGDKFSRFRIDTFPARHIPAPLIKGAIGWLECRVIPDASQKYDLFIAEVLAAYADPSAFHNGRWVFETPDKRSIHYVAGGHFFQTGDMFALDVQT